MHTSFDVRGVIVPLLTALSQDGRSIDGESVAAHVSWLIERRVHGLMPCGTTGEGPLLTVRERMRVLELVLEAADGAVPVIAHVGAATTDETIELALHARACGADAISVVTPYYFRLPAEAVSQHLVVVADAVADVPVFLYNIPQNTGNPLARATVDAVVAQCPNVIGIKDSSGDLESLLGYIRVEANHFVTICGSDSLLLPALRGGACASVSGNANLVPELVVELFEAFWAGDLELALRHQSQLDGVRRAVGDGGHLGLLKRAVELRGLHMGPPRRPIPAATATEIETARANLQALGVL